MTKPGEVQRFIQSAVESNTDDCIVCPYNPSQRYALVLAEGRMQLAHRVVFKMSGGVIGPGEEVSHLCGVARCLNPRHLRSVTRSENERHKRGHGTSPQGERHPSAKLTEEIVRMLRASDRPTKWWARKLGVYPTTVRNARTGETWSHVS